MTDTKNDVIPKIPLLCDSPPESIEVLDKNYPILTDFRRWIIVTQIFDARLAPVLTAECVAAAVCPSLTPLEKPTDEFYASFFGAAADFASRGKIQTVSESVTANSEKLFDFYADADLIYSAFYSEYGIDLSTSQLHWWKFLALLTALPYDCELMRIITLRQTDVSKIEDDAVRKKLRRAKAVVRIK